MKKIGLLLLLVCAACQLKAQQKTLLQQPLITPMHSLQPNEKSAQSYADSLTRTILLNSQQLPSASAYLNTLAATGNKNVVTQNFYSHMPLARLHSDDPMPVAGRNQPQIEPMPVKRMNIIKPNTGTLGQVLLNYNKLPVNGR